MGEVIVKPEIEIQKIQESYNWHKPAIYRFILQNGEKRTIKVKETITGCGIIQVAGISQINETNIELYKELFTKLIANYKSDSEGVGAIMATLGMNYYIAEPFILQLGFEMVMEYSNYRHGMYGRYKQRIYIMKL